MTTPTNATPRPAAPRPPALPRRADYGGHNYSGRRSAAPTFTPKANDVIEDRRRGITALWSAFSPAEKGYLTDRARQGVRRTRTASGTRYLL